MRIIIVLCIIGALWAKCGYAQIYKDKTVAVEARVEDLLHQMTLEEKIDYIGGYRDFYIKGIERLGVPALKLTDGPLGAHKDGKATAYPAGVLTASTWNRSLVYELGKQLGRDAKARGAHILLGPAVNIIRSPLCGRNFEYFTEDPYLNSQIAVAYVRGVQDQHVVATLKHFVANNQEWDRHNANSNIDERTLHEIYLPVYRDAIRKAEVGAIMDGYNIVNGVHVTQSDELNNQLLKKQWRFQGMVMSDWGATYNAIEAANGGLDLEMPQAVCMNRANLLPALQAGHVKMATIDDKVRRILRIMFRFGFYDNAQSDASVPYDNPAGREVALKLAQEGIVLLKNEKNLLPLDRSEVKSVAVIGPNANSYVAGGGSSYTFPFHSTNVLDGLKDKFQNAEFYYASGISGHWDAVEKSLFYTSAGGCERGLVGEYYDNTLLAGRPIETKVDTIICIQNGWHVASLKKGPPFDHCSIRWRGIIRPPKSADYLFTVRGFDGFRLRIDSETVIDAWREQGITTKESILFLESGREYSVVLEYFADCHPVDISFGWRENRVSFDEAVQIAGKADVAVINVGLNESLERESNDRSFELPVYQDSLIQAVSAVNKRTVVLVNAGGNIDMNRWVDQVPALLYLWYPGQEGGKAVADILSGDINPSAKLPVSFEYKWEDNPAFPYYHDTDGDKEVEYKEGLFLGYRYYDSAKVKPRFPFGYGLSYTKFKYADLMVRQEDSDTDVKVSFTISNIGSWDGSEVAQLYIRPMYPFVLRPYKELKGFEKIFIPKGQKKQVSMSLDKESFSYYKVDKKQYGYDSGLYEILIGTSSEDMVLSKVIEISAERDSE